MINICDNLFKIKEQFNLVQVIKIKEQFNLVQVIAQNLNNAITKSTCL